METLHCLSDEGTTIILIAHRLPAVARCDHVVRLEDGRIAGIGSYAEMVGSRVSR